MASDPKHQAQLHSLLWLDDVERWRVLSGSNNLESWVQENILHAMECCPKVIAFWLRNVPALYQETRAYHYVAKALDERLGDEQKLSFLKGKYQPQPRARGTQISRVYPQTLESFYRYITNEKNPWRNLSPSWVGPPNSALREHVLALGWSPRCLIPQVSGHLFEPRAQHWAQWVPFPHSLAVLQREYAVHFMAQQNLSTFPPEEHTSQPWANPADVALAQYLAAELPGPLQYTLLAHPDVARLSEEERKPLRQFVQTHVGLDMLGAMSQRILAGDLGLGAEQAHLMLPELELFNNQEFAP